MTMSQASERSQRILEEIVSRLVREIKPERVYLFGSRARDDFDPGSDFDLLIVVSESELPGYKRDRVALRALRGLRVAVDVIVLTREEFERKLNVVCSLAATVHREGKLLYAA
jgi:predicted nucleotidyltransferase